VRRVPERIVLHVLPHPGGGGQRYIDLLAGMPGYSFEQAELTRERRGAEAAAGAWRLRRRAPDWDLVHIHGETSTLLCAPLLRSRPGVFNFHGLHLSRRSGGLRLVVVRNRLRRATRLARAAICSSVSEREEASELVGPQLHSRLVTIESGVVIPPPPDPARREEARRELGLEADQIAVIYAAQLEPRKGPLDFLAALAHARAREPRLAGIMLGSGQLRNEVAAGAPASGVRLLGERPDFERLLEACEIFVLPSQREGLSLALLGAMAAGLAVIVADGPGNPETVADTGLIFPFGDPEALAEAILSLANDPEERRRLGAAARRRASSRYSAERTRSQMRELYNRALARPG
jgi:glycosyltransferase involved in cell wall biosynthesis